MSKKKTIELDKLVNKMRKHSSKPVKIKNGGELSDTLGLKKKECATILVHLIDDSTYDQMVKDDLYGFIKKAIKCM